MCIIQAVVSSLSVDWAQYEEKVPGVSDSDENVETTSISKLKFTDLFIKRVQKN